MRAGEEERQRTFLTGVDLVTNADNLLVSAADENRTFSIILEEASSPRNLRTRASKYIILGWQFGGNGPSSNALWPFGGSGASKV